MNKTEFFPSFIKILRTMDVRYQVKIWKILSSVAYYDIDYARYGYEEGINIALEKISEYLNITDAAELLPLIGYMQQSIIVSVLPLSPMNYTLLGNIRETIIDNVNKTTKSDIIVSMAFTLSLIYPKVTVLDHRNKMKEPMKYVYRSIKKNEFIYYTIFHLFIADK